MANKALDFDMIDDIVTVPAHASIANIFDGGGSIEVWIKPDSDGEASMGRIIQRGAGWECYLDDESAGTTDLMFVQGFTTTAGVWRTTAREITIGAWNYISITYNNGNVANDPIFYVNGSSVGITETLIPVGTRVDDSAIDLCIGNDPTKIRTFNGIIDEVRLSTKIRSQAEITATWNGGAGIQFKVDGDTVALWHINEDDGTIFDETANDNDGTIDGASWVDGYSFLQTIAPSGIASTEAFGTAQLNLIIKPTGIASEEAFGTALFRFITAILIESNIHTDLNIKSSLRKHLDIESNISTALNIKSTIMRK